MTRATPELDLPLQAPNTHTPAGGCLTHVGFGVYRAHRHGGSSVGSGFEPGALRHRSRNFSFWRHGQLPSLSGLPSLSVLSSLSVLPSLSGLPSLSRLPSLSAPVCPKAALMLLQNGTSLSFNSKLYTDDSDGA
ncbi:hypothetical protein AVEN_53478-1 [Araneus ventricosus]|uniref:Uncharacterized protein n=1 Tax=Araneus ventricosus TaxID=182803 RepID=A0A4Y2AB57_ARAVE|nr:hypothetical protein AVEN_53478-1 [Araneus ventricosus]